MEVDSWPSCRLTIAIGVPLLSMNDAAVWRRSWMRGGSTPAGDNAAMESFWALLQRNVLNSQAWRTREDLRYAIVYWIEHTYNRRRRQRGLGRLTPVEFELAFTDKPDQAAA